MTTSVKGGTVGLLDAWRSAVEAVLEHKLPRDAGEEPLRRLFAAMRYAVLGGGKRLRPLLLLSAAHAAGAEVEPFYTAAAAVELVHAYSLVHDDLPCMDDDDLRRGRPSCHVAHGEATALLAGDALLTMAFAWLAEPTEGVPAGRQILAVAQLAQDAGALGMIGGQADDLAAEGQEIDGHRLAVINARKTGRLFRAAVRMGGMLAGASPETMGALDAFSAHFGQAFQIMDDVLEEREALEKGLDSSDRRHRKATAVSLYGMAAAERAAEEETVQAALALRILGSRGDALVAVAHSALRRPI